MEHYFNLVIHDAFVNSLNYNLSYYMYNNFNYFSKVIQLTYASMNILKSFPYIYSTFYKSSNKEYRKFIIYNRFIIVYYIENTTVNIVYFYDGRKNSSINFENI